MRRVTGAVALATLALLGGCASSTPPEGMAAAPARTRQTAARGPAVECTTTYLVIATVSKCGADGYRFGVAGE